MNNTDISIIIQSQLKSVIENYPASFCWEQKDEVEIQKRVGITLNIYKHFYTKITRRNNDQSQNDNRQPSY